jgi:hypothetical protein
MGCEEKYIPCGIVDEDTGAFHIFFSRSYKTSDFTAFPFIIQYSNSI